MATVKISQLPSLTSVNSDSEIPVVQGGITYSSTVSDITSKALGTLTIIADGSIGGPLTLSSYYSVLVPQDTNGTNTFSVKGITALDINATNSNNGSAFTATQVTYPYIEIAGNVGIYNSDTIVSLSIPLLERVTGSLYLSKNPNFTTFNAPNLKSCAYIYFGSSPNLTIVGAFPLLESAYLQMDGTNDFTGYTQTDFPSLRSGGFQWGYGFVPSFTIDFPLLTKLIGFGGTSSINMNTIYLPALEDVYYYMYISNISALQNLTLGTVGVTKKWGGTSATGNAPQFFAQFCSLNQASVDNILIVLASLDGTNGTTYTNNGNVQLNGGSNATPSSAGLAAKTTLISRGFSVSNN